MKNKKNRISIEFTDMQMEMLKEEKKKTGNMMAAIIRQAVTEYFERKLNQKYHQMFKEEKNE